ncbi:oxaloacetate decarboxylase, gamma subunit [Campylobacter blaseri]|uniref:Probable oxaloacetate decarboxylase gamma chain n=1 Tax=Campylobacter blaseri TaxID=2042961 RepID=A0A2P8R0G5_9BACT|nr:OadG family protein [Campylobacter blaseri]PSM51979.1 pyruvate carboxylase [Campylobacter blaseri]PSM53764.1 pyruvate carboxylase [Campylobacter blaseri]QKF85682.1 oxaloacetate decarboxylase, gamma subunit [Campylobacter blaseri]
MEINLVAEGFKLMILGMSAVFLFLTIIIYTLKFQYYLINRFFPQNKNIIQKKELKNLDNDIDQDVVVAITAAIKQFQISQKGK